MTLTKKGGVRMETLMSAFQLMGNHSKQIFKLIGYQLLWILIFVLGLIPCLFLPILLFCYLPLIPYVSLFQYQAYQCLFIEENQDRLGIILAKTNQAFKDRGLRMFGCLLACGLVTGLTVIIVSVIVCGFLFTQLFSGFDFAAAELENAMIQTLNTGTLNLLLKIITISISLIFMFLSSLFQYIQGFVALGKQSVVELAFKNIKSVLLLVLINLGCSLIPFAGGICLMVINMVLPLKIILDSQQNYEQPYSSHHINSYSNGTY